jgi:thiamine kinase-like enzyme
VTRGRRNVLVVMSSLKLPKSPSALPVDPRLPELSELTDPERAVRVLAPSSPWPLQRARVRYLEHDPGRFFLVHLQVISGPDRHDVVVSRAHDNQVGQGGGGAPGKLRVDWFPADLGLPLLADPARLSELLHLERASAPRLLAWTPQRRAVLRIGEVIVKLYPTAAEATASRDHLVRVSQLLPSARIVHAEPAAGAVAQTALQGEPLTRHEALTKAAAAARVARQLHAATAVGLKVHTPEAMLKVCGPVARLVVFAQPELGARVHALLGRLRESSPAPEELVLSHGDFTCEHLVCTAKDQLALIDTDTLCLAPAALDLASYATNLVSGRDEDLTFALRVLEELVDGYGAAPPGLQWWLSASLLRRLDRAIRRLKRAWPQRTEALLSAAEQTVPP